MLLVNEPSDNRRFKSKIWFYKFTVVSEHERMDVWAEDFESGSNRTHQDALRKLRTDAGDADIFPDRGQIVKHVRCDRGEDLAPPYLRVVAGYSATVWPAMIFLAAAALPIVLMLYGEKWADVAPLLACIAISEIAFTALPLHMEIPLLLGRMRLLLALNILDTVASIGTLMLGALWGLEWAAMSRVAYSLIWLGIYAGLMHRLVGFRWSAMALIWAKSLALSIAATAPLLLVYAYLAGPRTITPLTLVATIATGALCWLAALFLVRHPARHELIGLMATAWSALRPAPAV